MPHTTEYNQFKNRGEINVSEPKCITEGYAYVDDESEQWCIKEDAPEWAKKEFKEVFGTINSGEDDNGVVTKY